MLSSVFVVTGIEHLNDPLFRHQSVPLTYSPFTSLLNPHFTIHTSLLYSLFFFQQQVGKSPFR